MDNLVYNKNEEARAALKALKAQREIEERKKAEEARRANELREKKAEEARRLKEENAKKRSEEQLNTKKEIIVQKSANIVLAASYLGWLQKDIERFKKDVLEFLDMYLDNIGGRYYWPLLGKTSSRAICSIDYGAYVLSIEDSNTSPQDKTLRIDISCRERLAKKIANGLGVPKVFINQVDTLLNGMQNGTLPVKFVKYDPTSREGVVALCKVKIFMGPDKEAFDIYPLGFLVDGTALITRFDWDEAVPAGVTDFQFDVWNK